MNKKYMFLGLSAILLLSCGMFFYQYSKKLKDTLTIRNKSGQTLENMSIEYASGAKIYIGDMPDSKVYKDKIDDSVDNSISLLFNDSQGVLYSEIIVGYVYPGITPVNVDIIANDSGNLIIKAR